MVPSLFLSKSANTFLRSYLPILIFDFSLSIGFPQFDDPELENGSIELDTADGTLCLDEYPKLLVFPMLLANPGENALKVFSLIGAMKVDLNVNFRSLKYELNSEYEMSGALSIPDKVFHICSTSLFENLFPLIDLIAFPNSLCWIILVDEDIDFEVRSSTVLDISILPYLNEVKYSNAT